MKFLLVASIVLAVVAAETCTPGTLFQKSCNWCRCLSDGKTMACTDKMCPENQLTAKQVCKPKALFKIYCNTCWCSDDGTDFACTKMMCNENVRNEDGTLKVKEQNRIARSGDNKICTPSSQFKVSCNTCTCSEDGLSKFCTVMNCVDNVSVSDDSFKTKNDLRWGPKYKQGDACKPGQIFYSECNQCVCSKTGRGAYCALKDC